MPTPRTVTETLSINIFLSYCCIPKNFISKLVSEVFKTFKGYGYRKKVKTCIFLKDAQNLTFLQHIYKSMLA